MKSLNDYIKESILGDCGYKPEIKDSIYMADSGKGRGCAFSISYINQCMKVIGSIYIK